MRDCGRGLNFFWKNFYLVEIEMFVGTLQATFLQLGFQRKQQCFL